MKRRLGMVAAAVAAAAVIPVVGASVAHADAIEGVYPTYDSCMTAGATGYHNGVWGPVYWCTPDNYVPGQTYYFLVVHSI